MYLAPVTALLVVVADVLPPRVESLLDQLAVALRLVEVVRERAVKFLVTARVM